MIDNIGEVLGKHIWALNLVGTGDEKEALQITFRDSPRVCTLMDDGQSCCESRYMRTDDDLTTVDGAILLDIEIRDAPPINESYGEHEVQFLVLKTTKGNFTFSNHNEHNGYYGGFAIHAKVK